MCGISHYKYYTTNQVMFCFVHTLLIYGYYPLFFISMVCACHFSFCAWWNYVFFLMIFLIGVFCFNPLYMEITSKSSINRRNSTDKTRKKWDILYKKFKIFGFFSSFLHQKSPLKTGVLVYEIKVIFIVKFVYWWNILGFCILHDFVYIRF